MDATPTGVYTKNITNYLNPQEIYEFKAYNPTTYPFFEYYQAGNKIVFSESFQYSELADNRGYLHGNANIIVEFKSVVSNVRVKIVMRNTVDNSSVTPIIDNYTLKLRVKK
jgi:hypothetical protein